MFKNADEVLRFIADEQVKFVDIRFTDVPGVQQHFNVPAKTVDADFFVNGQLFDGSSIRGFQGIAESDMQLIPDVTTAFIDPFRIEKTLALNFSIVNPRTGEPYHRDPRGVAERAEAYLASTGIADTAFFGSEAEFYIFDNVQYESSPKGSFYKVDSEEAPWNSGREEEGGNLGNKTPYKGGYFPVAPVDKQADLRDAISVELDNVGLEVERAHHEVGGAGQAEINYKFTTLTHAADDLQKFKYIVKNVADAWGKSATFMPKPIFGDNGSGMHCHQSLWNGGVPLFYDEKGYAGLSDLARWYIGGLLKHASAVLAFTNPTVNSYRRLVKGFEAPVNMVYSQGNRSAAIRIPITGSNPKAKRLEFRAPDPSSNPYLAFSAQLMAGLDGIKNRIEPADPIDKDLYELPPEEAKHIQKAPASLEEALVALENDNEFLQAGGVFTQDMIDSWISYKREFEILPLALRPNPFEFELYYGV
ncbi:MULTISPECIES: type I glutamate--ammonia ligase [unclassified Arthrobacter]|uniref:type I glutamate--ammonia ligase n=1 Tax=unclassified Arthrobacter TaxID=235627 RepID=UPI001E4B9B99|nr:MULTISPECIES: type I glutamate--ammonia ligase [unclassified Arthrobacter]MCC9175036.1 type I glutamate--ammonia ligase [Arthrobacter sp. zg-Y179]MCQ1946613.1 type I glutamate--ammonia ligase [Arthrobacter sp. zg-Y1116]MCQ1987252.1 type I glutamate--ammonia ligase [Arthrobacter sp. zg-Y844]MCQ1995915.1 type I glutamate--ammonia ligase [Arthrobacter sp. zg-Y1171]UWX83006.1 type I glutamate--ammonia ligase [Arthrobacter sp. zg-Y1171]